MPDPLFEALPFAGSASGIASLLNDALPLLLCAAPSVLPLLQTEPALLPARDPAAAFGAAAPLPLPADLPLLLLPSAGLGRGGICWPTAALPLPAGAASPSELSNALPPSKLVLRLPCRTMLLPLLQSLPATCVGGRGGSTLLGASCCCGCPAIGAVAAAPAAAAAISWLPLLDSVQPLLDSGMLAATARTAKAWFKLLHN
jgi:hypothetical protein